MKIKVIETGKEVELKFIDPITGIDHIEDVVGVNDSFGDPSKGNIGWEVGEYGDVAYQAKAETVEWWQRYIDDYNTTADEISALADELDVSRSAVQDYVNQMIEGWGMSDHRHYAQAALAQLREDPSLLE